MLTETQMAGGPAFDGIKEVGGSQIAQGLDRALDISAGEQEALIIGGEMSHPQEFRYCPWGMR